MAASLTANPDPFKFAAGPLGNIFVTGAVSGLAQWQNPVNQGDRRTRADLSNAHLYLQNTEGPVQFFLQVGPYSLPSLGVPYVNFEKTTNSNYGWVPLGYIELVPDDNWSVQVGKLSALSGLEATFTYQNMNIERGLLWNQTNSIERGVQINYTNGPLDLALSVNDGYYSNRFSWVSGSVTWTFDNGDTLSFAGAGNTRTTTVSTVVTPILANNSQIYNVNYTHASGPWTVSGSLQSTYVPRATPIQTQHDAETYGAELLLNYRFGEGDEVAGMNLDGVSLPVRLEYITSTGNAAEGAPNLLYGQGSNAWSFTFTPTYQYKIYFIRGEYSYVQASHVAAGAAFGPAGNNTGQTRLLLETGVLF